tara:strand:+ start:116 stop:1357 length:1242 start_codon:yes stop_codon:yes gene_type:complete
MSITFSERYKLYQPVVLSDTFEVTFPVFDDDDLRVDVDGVDEPLFYVTATYSDGVSNDAVITLASSVTGVDVEIYGERAARRENNYLANSPNLSQNLQRDMDAITGVQQEQARDFGRAFKLSSGVDAVASLAVSAINRAGRVFGFSADGLGLVIGATFDEIANAEANATAAAQSAADAAAAEASLLKNEGAWLTATDYGIGDIVQESGTSYHCEIAHTSGVFNTDLAAVRWTVFAAKGNAGAGTGDMLAANNLSDLFDIVAARTTLGLGSAAVKNFIDNDDLSVGPTAIPLRRNVAAAIAAAVAGGVPNHIVFDGTDGTIKANSGFVSGVVRNSAGDYTLTFSARANANYTVLLSCSGFAAGGTGNRGIIQVKADATSIILKTTTQLTITAVNTTGGAIDPFEVYVQIIGDAA